MRRIICICLVSVVLFVGNGCQVDLTPEYIQQSVGKCDDELSAYEPVIEESDTTNGGTVWIPRTGKRYHRNGDCSGMKDPRRVMVQEASAMGFTPCQNCCG